MKRQENIFEKEDIEHQIDVMNSRIENVKESVYPESVLTWDSDYSKDIVARIVKAITKIIVIKRI